MCPQHVILLMQRSGLIAGGFNPFGQSRKWRELSESIFKGQSYSRLSIFEQRASIRFIPRELIGTRHVRS